MNLPIILTDETYGILSAADITCKVMPDSWVFIDGRLNKWDNFTEELNSGDISFDSIKVSLRRFAAIARLLKDYEQSDYEETLEEESNLRTAEHIKLRSGSRK